MPAAAWQHRPFWIFPEDRADGGTGGGHDPLSHSLLGGRMTVSGSPTRRVWQTRLDMDSRPYPQSHGLVGVEVTPAASIINTFVAAAGEEGTSALSDIVLRTPLAVDPPRVVQVVREGRSLSLSTRVADTTADDEGDAWITHTMAVSVPDARLPGGTMDVDPLRSRLPEGPLDRADQMFGRMGVEGYAFPWEMRELRFDADEQFALLEMEPAPATRASSWAHVIDGALTVSAMVVSPGDASVLWMSRSIDEVRWRGEPPARIHVHSTRSPRSPHDTVDVRVADEHGEIVCEVAGLRFAAVDHLGSTATPRDLVYEVVWRPLEEALTGQTGQEALDQVVLVGVPELTAPLEEGLTAAGVPCVRVAGADELGADTLTRPGAVVVLPPPPREDEALEETTERTVMTLVRAVQRVARLQADTSRPIATQRVWCLTRGVRSAHAEESLAQGPLWGLARVVAGEHPDLWGGVVDVPELNGNIAKRLPGVLRDVSGGLEDVVSLTEEGAHAARLSRIERSADRSPLRCSPAGTVLVTGGLGALGLETARWLVERGARRLLLVGRQALPARAEWASVSDPETRRRIDGVLALEALGVTVKFLGLDITDHAAVAAALDPDVLDMPPVTGVVHAAGVVNDALVHNVEPDGLREVLAPKVGGALVLHRLFPPGSLDFFVMFSSCGQFARLSGQAAYASANSFLDALAAHRNSGGGKETVSLGWTAWRGVGLSSDIGTVMLEANSRGLEAVSTAEALRAWDFGTRFQSGYQAVLRALPAPSGALRPPMLRDLEIAAEAADSSGEWLAHIADLSEEEARERVFADVCEQVAAELNLDPSEIEPRRPLVEMGVDSVMTVALRVRVRARYGTDLPPTILWAKPSVEALADHLSGVLHQGAEGGGEPETDGSAPSEPVGEPA
ncbi:KR domain-containing protein [Nocardiopsis sp. CNR-923]|uniref:KR domain-containing protein n=1 Tax=Nocardiopsis sp. CNR-923 TaxID=1904965 RepID=UPI0021CCD476|nr:KR domain-containing protein [Nocardiopsis sp. CNR-923]